MALARSAELSVLAKECLTVLIFLVVSVSEPAAWPVQPLAAVQEARAGEVPQIPSLVVQDNFSMYLEAVKPVVILSDLLAVKSVATGAVVALKYLRESVTPVPDAVLAV